MMLPVAGGDPVELVSPGQAPTWSPDDQLIGYQSGGMSKDAKTVPQGLSVIGVDGTGQRLIDGSATSNPWAYAYPQWSLDRDGSPTTQGCPVTGLRHLRGGCRWERHHGDG